MVAGDVSAPSGRRGRSRRPGNPDGAMTLMEHLREFQTRLFRAVLGIMAGAAVAWLFYDQLFNFIRAPFDSVVEQARAQGKQITLAINGVTDAFSLQLEIVLIGGLILSLPIWLYQLWRFLAPGLKGNERRWAYVFVVGATPLFLIGAGVAYRVMPSLLHLLLGFTPENVANIINVSEYLAFTIQLMVFFGIGMVVPLIFVMMNFAGLLRGSTLVRAWRWLLVGVLTFAAVATPSGDPVNMLIVATPFGTLVFIAVLIMVINDKRRDRRQRREGFGQWSDDETSPMPEQIVAPEDLRPSSLDDDIT